MAESDETTDHASGGPHILVVEDDDNLRLPLVDVLEDEGFSVQGVATGGEAIEAAQARAPAVVILDIMLPDIDGYAVCSKLREAGSVAGVLMLTARTLEDDVVRGFDAGADDYLAKPYRLRELLARVRSLLRRAGAPATTSAGMTIGAWAIDRDARIVSSADTGEIELTRTEFDLLLLFADHPGKALPRERILERVWGDVSVDPRTVDNFVSSLKRKLSWTRDCGWAIRAVRGVGYRFENE